MKIYKVYNEMGEANENSKSAFEDITILQNAGTAEYFTDKEKALKAYNDIKIWENAARLHYITTTYRFEGKLIESCKIPENEYNESVENGESLQDIYDGAWNWEIEKIAVSEIAE